MRESALGIILKGGEPMKNKTKPVTKEQQSRQDPLGMWTGVPKDPYEKPVQDADDL